MSKRRFRILVEGCHGNDTSWIAVLFHPREESSKHPILIEELENIPGKHKVEFFNAIRGTILFNIHPPRIDHFIVGSREPRVNHCNLCATFNEHQGELPLTGAEIEHVLTGLKAVEERLDEIIRGHRLWW